MKYLINLDPKKLIQTGRPQLDFIKPIKLDTKNRPVVIYTTTYEATHRSMRYTSVDVYGERIVNQIIDSNKYFFIYKPHPNLGGNDPKVREIHKRLIKKVESSPYAVMLDKDDVNNIYPLVDFAIFDMSSTMTDFLNVNKPFLLADVFNPKVHKVSDYNILKGCNRLTHDNIDNLLDIIEDEIINDPMKEKREEVKKLYLGEYKEGQSIKKFISSITDIINQRDNMMEQKRDPLTNELNIREIDINRSRGDNGYENIAIYFFGDLSAIYQLEQFKDVFKAIDKREKIRFVVRNLKVYRYLKAETDFNITYCYTIDDVLTYYENNDFKLILYINDGYKNFQSLIYHRALHLYLDFGDNDNYIEQSSQSKGFDYIYFKDDKVYKRYERNIINMPKDNYIAIGDILEDRSSQEELIDRLFMAMKKRDRLLSEKNMLNTIH
jgi:CDP-glycerol glycerophosphotransferase (TagB/SpsB family)